MINTPSFCNWTQFLSVAGFSHICSFMAGTITLGAVVASKALVTKLSAIPFAIFAIVLAVAGMTIANSLQSAK